MNSPKWIQNSWPGQTRKFFETFSDVPWWTLSAVSAIRETNFELWTVTNMAPGYPAAAGLPTCRPRESTYAPPLLSRHHLRIGNLLANFVQCFVPFRRPRLPLILPRAFFQANVPPETTEFTSTFHRTVRQHAFRLPFLSPIRNLSDHEQPLTSLSRCILRVGTSSD